MTDDEESRPLRRRILQATTAGLATGLAGCLGVLDDPPRETPEGSPDSTPDETGVTGTPAETPTDSPADVPGLLGEGPAVGPERVATGVRLPTDLASPGGDDGRLFVTDQFGAVYAFDPDGETPVDLRERDPFLDLRDRIVTGTEAGLLGLAFHPDFAANGRLFVRYSSPPPDGAEDISHVEVLVEFHAPGDRTSADPDSGRILLEVPQKEDYHNSGSVEFGPDDYLYLTTGDGGAFDDPPDDWPRAGVSQNTRSNLLGGVLRIDVDAETEDRPYGIPPDNPLVDREGHRGEYYAWGFRNPWGVSFDGEDCYVADVGTELFECVDRVERGGNYGWPITEGTSCFDPLDQTEPLDDCPDRTPDQVRGGEPLLDPVIEYPHQHAGEELGMAVVGGGVYRGSALPGLQGEYVFGELEGRLFAASPPGDGDRHSYYRDRDLWPIRELDLAGVEGVYDRHFPVIGEGPDGELHVGTTDIFAARDGEFPGGIHRIDPADE